jgi:hypothetical protein
MDLIARYRDQQTRKRARRRLEETGRPHFTAEQRLLILDSWLRSKLPAGDFAPLVGISLHTLRISGTKGCFACPPRGGSCCRPDLMPVGGTVGRVQSRQNSPERRGSTHR